MRAWLVSCHQARKSGENRYSFSFPLWFALKHHVFVEKWCPMLFWGTTGYAVFRKKKTKKFYDSKLIFWSFATFFVVTFFWLGAKQRFCFTESMSVNSIQFNSMECISSIWHMEESPRESTHMFNETYLRIFVTEGSCTNCFRW